MSGITANPSVGAAFDQLVRLGATCIFEEPGELIGCGGFLRERASDIHLGNQLYNCIVKANNYYKQMRHDISSGQPQTTRRGLNSSDIENII